MAEEGQEYVVPKHWDGALGPDGWVNRTKPPVSAGGFACTLDCVVQRHGGDLENF